MRWNWVLAGLGLLAALTLAYAWIDGGREPVRPIVQAIAMPGEAK